MKVKNEIAKMFLESHNVSDIFFTKNDRTFTQCQRLSESYGLEEDNIKEKHHNTADIKVKCIQNEPDVLKSENI